MNFTKVRTRYLFIFSFILYGMSINAQTLKRHIEITNDSVYIHFINPFYADIETNLKPLDSTKSYTEVNPYGILKYRDTLKNAIVLPLIKVEDTSKIETKKYVSFSGSFGNPNSKIDYNFPYILPFKKGKQYKVIQGFGGKFSHREIASKYAIDFGLKIGDTIVAARAGKVFYTKQDSKEYCKTRQCIKKANKILILHNDGTYANYVHLDYNGALVKVGDYVKAGQPIGISGMTGFTTTPHLHFVVHKARGISIPINFKNYSGKKLKQGKYYRRKK